MGPSDAATDSWKIMAVSIDTCQLVTELALLRPCIFLMILRAFKRDAMIEYIASRTPPDRTASHVSSFHTFQSPGGSGPAGGYVEAPDLKF